MKKLIIAVTLVACAWTHASAQTPIPTPTVGPPTVPVEAKPIDLRSPNPVAAPAVGDHAGHKIAAAAPAAKTRSTKRKKKSTRKKKKSTAQVDFIATPGIVGEDQFVYAPQRTPTREYVQTIVPPPPPPVVVAPAYAYDPYGYGGGYGGGYGWGGYGGYNPYFGLGFGRGYGRGFGGFGGGFGRGFGRGFGGFGGGFGRRGFGRRF